jgi:hypothetical protein
MDTFPYLPGDESGDSQPLARFLPPVPAGVGVAFLSRHSVSSEWVLDPFGAAPSLIVELARAGKNVLVAVNNPITRFLLELTAAPPVIEELRLALSQLATLRKGEERMETHLQSLYLTGCTRCQRQVPAEAFIWEKGKTVPSARIYNCPCGESGEFPATEADQARAVRIAATDNLHRARALERVAAPDDPDRSYVEQALDCYLPRAVYAIITIINKLDGIDLSRSKEHQRAMLALVLSACDEASALWPHPTERPRPRQLAVPPRFLEKNIWLSLERAVDRWSSETPVEMSDWAATPNGGGSRTKQGGTGGIYVFDGPAREIIPAIKAIQPGAVVTALPRPSQAYWTLSALWAGWLWGRAATAPFKSVVRRRRYDWDWHTDALQGALKTISPHLPLNTPLFAILPEPEPAFLTASLLAAAEAGFDLEGLALRSRGDAAQLVWRRRAFLREEKEPPAIDPQAVEEALKACLRSRGEPTSYMHLHAAGLAAMAAEHSLRHREEAIPAHQAPIHAALNGPGFFHHSESSSIESGLWALSHWDTLETLSDKVEISLVNHLQKNPGASFRDLEIALNAEFPGLLTPSLDLLRAILASYAVESGGTWTLRPEDSPTTRRVDLDSAMQILSSLAPRLGYSSASQDKPWRILHWLEAGRTVYAFHILASAVAGKILRTDEDPPQRCVLVLPGGRAGLLAFKLDRDPGLRSSAEGWRVLKFRQLRRLAELTNLTRQQWEKELSGDQLEPPEQMKLF